jgi:hypothetical protein
MPMIHEELDAVLLGADRIGLALVADVGALERELTAARGALVLAYHALDHEGRLLGQAIQAPEGVLAEVGEAPHALDRARAVADHEKEQLAARSAVREPALNPDRGADMAPGILDANGFQDPLRGG